MFCNLKDIWSQAWWRPSVIPALASEAGGSKFEASLSYIARLCPKRKVIYHFHFLNQKKYNVCSILKWVILGKGKMQWVRENGSALRWPE